MFIDAHAHLTDAKLFEYEPSSNIDAIITSSYKADNLIQSLQLSQNNSKYYTTLGIHPQYCDDYDDDIENFIYNHATLQNDYPKNEYCEKNSNISIDIFNNKLINNNQSKVVAIGEIGLDKKYNTDYEVQKQIFIKQLDLAEKLQLPVVCHIRNCFDDFFEIMASYKNISFMVHAFCGCKNDCFRIIDAGGYISFACNITYKRHIELRKLATVIPLNRILIETDSPSMLPASYLRKGFNTPSNVKYVAETIANERKTDIENVARATRENAIKFYSLNKFMRSTKCDNK